MTKVYPPVMSASAIHERQFFEDHANVLAIVATYQEKYRAMPWGVLVAVVASLPSIDSRLALSKPDVCVEDVLMDVVIDLLQRGLVKMTTLGVISTACGQEYIRSWSDKFEDRLSAARKDLATLRFEGFAEL